MRAAAPSSVGRVAVWSAERAAFVNHTLATRHSCHQDILSLTYPTDSSRTGFQFVDERLEPAFRTGVLLAHLRHRRVALLCSHFRRLHRHSFARLRLGELLCVRCPLAINLFHIVPRCSCGNLGGGRTVLRRFHQRHLEDAFYAGDAKDVVNGLTRTSSFQRRTKFT